MQEHKRQQTQETTRGRSWQHRACKERETQKGERAAENGVHPAEAARRARRRPGPGPAGGAPGGGWRRLRPSVDPTVGHGRGPARIAGEAAPRRRRAEEGGAAAPRDALVLDGEPGGHGHGHRRADPALRLCALRADASRRPRSVAWV